LTTLDFALKNQELRYPLLKAVSAILQQERALDGISQHG
jgi:hypothetical protein